MVQNCFEVTGINLTAGKVVVVVVYCLRLLSTLLTYNSDT